MQNNKLKNWNFIINTANLVKKKNCWWNFKFIWKKCHFNVQNFSKSGDTLMFFFKHDVPSLSLTLWPKSDKFWCWNWVYQKSHKQIRWYFDVLLNMSSLSLLYHSLCGQQRNLIPLNLGYLYHLTLLLLTNDQRFFYLFAAPLLLKYDRIILAHSGMDVPLLFLYPIPKEV